jgi:predicted P-loop ATPase
VTTTKQASDVKQFVTSTIDVFRAPYGRAVAPHPRSAVIVGTTNEKKFHNDATGSRRFWIVRVGRPIDTQALADWRDQLWAEAVQAYAGGEGERWWLDDAQEAARAGDAEQHFVEDPWAALIEAWLESPCAKAEPITALRIMSMALELDAVHQTQAAMNRVGRIMRGFGWDNPRTWLSDRGEARRQIRVWVRPKGTRERANPAADAAQ